MVLSSDLWYLKENYLKQKSAVLKHIFFKYKTKKCENFPFCERGYNSAEGIKPLDYYTLGKYPAFRHSFEIAG